MKFDSYFKLTSYAVVACGALALLVSGGISIIVMLIFAAAMIMAWRLESSRWQISERLGLVIIVLSLPLYYLDWQYQVAALPRERAGAAALAHLILGLSVIKLWQKKVDRDWVFLYLISFFEVLLAAGLSISPTFLATLVLYLLFAASTIVAFEIRKSERDVKILDLNNQNVLKSIWRLPVAATLVLFFIATLAMPLFFIMPRVGGAGLGGRNGGGVSGFVGFSTNVKLGAIGKIQQSDEVVMRVRIENGGAALLNDLRWRGVALDYFDNQGWSKSVGSERTTMNPDEKGLFRFGTAEKVEDLLQQTIYLEPIDTPVLFGASRVVAIQGSFPTLTRDSDESVNLNRALPERVLYRVYSDISQPNENQLRADDASYQRGAARYLQIPNNLDPRIGAAAQKLVRNAGNRYDAARAIENYLQTNFGYTLDLKANGEQPLADFLFNVREGHCEYFATSMAIMLRTQGIAARVVNGFQTGDYNDAADAFIVSQRQAHSWVEVYFPESDAWVTFDPTPAVGRNLPAQANAGGYVQRQFNKYLEAAEMFWMQYVVAYDNQEQRSLARSFREQLLQNQDRAANFLAVWREQIEEWWRTINGARGAAASWRAIAQTVLIITGIVTLIITLWLVGKRVSWQKIFAAFRLGRENNARRIVDFYERMIKALAKRGLQRQPSQTPLEFATTIGASEAVKITEAYNRVRFGAQNLTSDEAVEIEKWLQSLEAR